MLFETLQFSKVRNRNRLSIDVKGIESLSFRPARDIGMKTFARFNQRRENLQRPVFCRRLGPFDDFGETLFLDGQIAIGTKLCSRFREEQSQKMINLRHRRDG